jgi:threonine/homoserine/homoserine lactone efflux protein
VSLVHQIPLFALTALMLAIVPGQGMAMVMRQTMLGGARTGLLSVAGNSTGLLIWGILSAVGLSQVFEHSPLAYNILKYVGVAYLSFLAASTLWTLRNGVGAFDPSGEAVKGPGAAIRLGLLTNLTNVKACVFAVAFIPQFVPRSIPLGVGIVLLAVVQVCVSTLWWIFFVTSVDKMTRVLAHPKVRLWLTAVSAAGLIALAFVLLVSSSR